MDGKLVDNVTLGQYISNIEANPAEAQAIRRIDIRTDDYDNFKRLRATDCGLELDGIMLDVREGTEFDESLRSTLEWLLACMASKVERFVVDVNTPTQAFLDFILPLLDNAALDLSESRNLLNIFDHPSDFTIEEAVYRRSTRLLDYFPSLSIQFDWRWPVTELNTTNTILLKAALQAKNVRTAIFFGLDLEAGDQLGKIIAQEVDQIYLEKLIFGRTHLSLGRFPHEIVEKSKQLTNLTVEYHPDNRQHIMMGVPNFITVCETGFEAIRKMLEAGTTITCLQLINVTNLKTNDGFSIGDYMPNLEYLVINNTRTKPLDNPAFLSLDLTLTDIASLCGPSLKHLILQVGRLACVESQTIDQYIHSALVEVQEKCPNLEVLHLQSFQPYADIKYRDDRYARSSLVADNHSASVHERIVAQATAFKFAPSKLRTLYLSFTGDKDEQVIFRRIFKWDKSRGYARLNDLEYDLQKPRDFKRKIVHLPIELEELHGVPDLMVNSWAETIQSLPRAEV